MGQVRYSGKIHNFEQMYQYAARILKADKATPKQEVIDNYLKHSKEMWDGIKSRVGDYIGECVWEWCPKSELYTFK